MLAGPEGRRRAAAFVDQVPSTATTLRLRDSTGAPLLGFDLELRGVTSGGLVPAKTTTSSGGVATVVARPGLLPRDYFFTASFDDLHGQPVMGSPVTFQLTAVAPDAGTIFHAVNDSLTAWMPGNDGAGVGTVARLSRPSALAPGPGGEVYFAEYGTHRVKRLTAEGTVLQVAGTGNGGTGGDNGPATDAMI